MQDIEQIYTEYSKTVYKYLYCLTHDANLSEELTQETFYIAVKEIPKFKGNCKVYVWLCQIAKHLWYKELRNNKHLENTPIEELETQYDTDTIEKIVNDESKIEIYKKIQKLDKETKDVMYLKLTGELSFKEIGEILNKNETWARVTFFRGKQKIKEVD